MEDKNRIPYNQELTYRHMKFIRLSRNKTQHDFVHFMGVDQSTIGKLERGELAFTPYYEEKLKDAVKRLRVSSIEMASFTKIIEMKSQRGYK